VDVIKNYFKIFKRLPNWTAICRCYTCLCIHRVIVISDRTINTSSWNTKRSNLPVINHIVYVHRFKRIYCLLLWVWGRVLKPDNFWRFYFGTYLKNLKVLIDVQTKSIHLLWLFITICEQFRWYYFGDNKHNTNTV